MRSKILRIISIAWNIANGRKDAQSSKVKKHIIKETSDVDFTNITRSWQKAQHLQAELRKKCHPDKFPDELTEKATEIFQAVGRNRYNYEELLNLKEQAMEELLNLKEQATRELHITISEQQ